MAGVMKPSPGALRIIDDLEGGLAIVCNGDTAPKNIAAGQYLFIKNHSTLSTGGYHATAAITSGGTISGSNVAADADGIANALDSKYGKELWNDTAFKSGSVTIPELSKYKLFILVFDDTIQMLATLIGNILWGGCNIGTYAADGIGSYGCRYGVSGNQITINATNRGYTNGTTSNYSGNTTGLIRVYGIV